jgi:hypothetical protein
MKHFDQNVTDEMRKVRSSFINSRWTQLHGLAKETGDAAVKYLFTTNSGGAVAVLAYLGSLATKGPTPLSAKISLIFFFAGIVFIGAYKAYMVHNHEGLYDHYKILVSQYYEGKIGWGALTKSDETKVGNSMAPYIFGYLSFACFIGGCISGAVGIL